MHMKKLIVNMFATTGISLILLATIALFYKAEYLYIPALFQTLGANIVIHLCLMLLRKLELKYPILEISLDISIVIITLIVFGAIFGWFSNTPIWILTVMSFIMYGISLFLNLMSMKKEAEEINALIQRRNKKRN